MGELRVGDRVEGVGTEPATSTTPGNIGKRFEGVVEAVCCDPRGGSEVVAYLVFCKMLDSFICDVRPDEIHRVVTEVTEPPGF